MEKIHTPHTHEEMLLKIVFVEEHEPFTPPLRDSTSFIVLVFTLMLQNCHSRDLLSKFKNISILQFCIKIGKFQNDSENYLQQ